MARADITNQMTRAGLNLIQQALTIYDAELKLAVCNRPFQTMFGLPAELVTPGARFEDTIRYLVGHGEYGDVEDPERFVLDRVEQARAFVPHYMERQRSNGRTISVEGSPLPEGGWVTVYTDITEIKRQEKLLRSRSEELSDQLLTHAERLAQTNRELAATNAQLEEAKRGLSEMEARIRLTTEMMPAHIAHVDRDQVYTYTNRRLSAILPGRASDIVGLHMAEALGPATAARLSSQVARALEGAASVLEFTEPESGRRIRTAFTPDEGAGGEIEGVYLLSTDVTEEAQARAALSQTHKRELAAQLTSGLAHDFANLLTIILGLQGRLEKLPLPPGAAELTGATKSAARRGGMLLDKIARMSGPREIHPVPTDLSEMLAAFAPLAGAALPDTITLVIDVDPDPQPPLLLDAGSLQDSLLNLVLNARDAIGQEAGEIAIRVRAVSETWLEITVLDTGPGFTEQALKAALDPFFTTKGEHGSGLGLSMVYDLTQLAGGTVKLSNTPRGAAVSLRLPLRHASGDTRAHLVLLVEDQTELRATIRDMLTGLGHQVIEAASGAEALALADLPGLDWVLSDINLEGDVTGVDLLTRIADLHPRHRLALMTALPHGDPLRQKGAARWPVLSKPLDPAALTHLFHAEAVA
ncbi:PAS-domain containing protein [Boseongicola sp. H5]|uniref:hybrid sensor histidine kinase/response regulator n=1 Tax=Boseongicola sp. H5 TaxID=2763261 RepID=UPI001D0BC590|nr:PAS-domain containing protein [Boseongicola sp. H5]